MNLGLVWGPGPRLGTDLSGYFCVAFSPQWCHATCFPRTGTVHEGGWRLRSHSIRLNPYTCCLMASFLATDRVPPILYIHLLMYCHKQITHKFDVFLQFFWGHVVCVAKELRRPAPGCHRATLLSKTIIKNIGENGFHGFTLLHWLTYSTHTRRSAANKFTIYSFLSNVS